MSIGINLLPVLELDDFDKVYTNTNEETLPGELTLEEFHLFSYTYVESLLILDVGYRVRNSSTVRSVFLISGIEDNLIEENMCPYDIFSEELLTKFVNQPFTSQDSQVSETMILASFQPSKLGMKLAELMAKTLSITGKDDSIEGLLNTFKEEVSEEFIHKQGLESKLEHFASARSLGYKTRALLMHAVNTDFELGSKLIENDLTVPSMEANTLKALSNTKNAALLTNDVASNKKGLK